MHVYHSQNSAVFGSRPVMMRQRSTLDIPPILKRLGLGRVLGRLYSATRPETAFSANVHDDARRHHTIISGTGRAGTTFLVKLLTNLGLDTGYQQNQMQVWSNCNAGLERDLRDDAAPYIVKSPWICDYIEEVVADESIAIDFAIIPMRVLEAAAESRRHVERETKELPPNCLTPPGGLWHTTDPTQQETVLAHQFHKLFVGLAKTQASIILLHYPRLTRDPQYLFNKLQPILGRAVSLSTFRDVFAQTVDASLVHRFTHNDA
jgi:hypothetical protein